MPIDVFLLGDSHMSTIKSGAETIDIKAEGGATLPLGLIFRGALKFNEQNGISLHEINDNRPLQRPISYYDERFRASLKAAGFTSVADINVPLITNFGCNPTVIARDLIEYSFDAESKKRYISKDFVKDTILDQMAEQIKVVRWLHAHLPKVCFAFPPIGGNVSREIWLYCEEVLSDLYRSFGALTYSPVSWGCSDDHYGGLLPEYRNDREGVRDSVHGNAKFGARVAVDCLRLLSVMTT